MADIKEIEKAIEILRNTDGICGVKYINGVETGYLSPHAKKPLQLAIQALQEKEEREKGCEYCKDVECLNGHYRTFYKEFPHDARFLTTLDDAHLQIAHDIKSGWVLHFEDDNGGRMFDIKINVCPNCGRKLGDSE